MSIKRLKFKRNPPSKGRALLVHLRGKKPKAKAISTRLVRAQSLRGKKSKHVHPSRYDATHRRVKIVSPMDSEQRQADAKRLLDNSIRIECQSWPL